jgi:polyhydroxyalkanoate synthase
MRWSTGRTWSTCSGPSIVKGLLARGEDVYIIDWGYPDRRTAYLTLEDTSSASSAARSTTCGRVRACGDQPARHLPGRRLRAVLRALHPEGAATCHHGHAGGFPHDGQHAVELGARAGRRLFVDTLGNVPAD